MRIATPSSCRTSTDYSLPVSPAHCENFSSAAPLQYLVEIERGIPVTAKTVAELRALSTWPPGDFVLDVRIDPDHRFRAVMADWPSYTSR
jgi:hypothetical protein